MTTYEQVQSMLVMMLDVEARDIKPETNIITDLGADSLALVELVLEAEERFEIDIPDEDTESIRTVQDVVDYIAKRTTQASPAGEQEKKGQGA